MHDNVTPFPPAAEHPPMPPQGRGMDVFFGDKFTRTLFRPARHKALYGGRGSGKSWSVATWLLIEAGKSKKRIVCCRQFQNSIRDSSKELLEKRINDLNLYNQFTITDRTLTHNGTGSIFLFMGLERNIESIRSLEGADYVWIEEARTINLKSMEVLLPTVRKKGSEMIWTWNPEQPTDPVDAYFRHHEAPPNSIVTEVNYRDNPFFRDTEMGDEMEVLRRGNPDRFKHVWEGAYDLRHESKVFPGVRIGKIDIDPDKTPARYGMDFGFGSDPSFVVKLYVNDEKKQIYIADEACGRVAMDDLPGLVYGVVGISSRELIKADSSQPGTIEFLRRRGLNIHGAIKGPGSIKSGINFLQSYDLVIDPSCEHLREEARLYSWQTDRLTGQILSAPVDSNNHGWDAVRYAVEDLSIEGADASEDPYGGVMRLFKSW
jgi:phage terminase large subunit